jgi:hypothetical protein
MVENRLRAEMQAVKQLGDRIGYGNLISWASALWRASLREQGFPESGAFIGVCECSIKRDCLDRVHKQEAVYDAWLNKLQED